VNPAKNAVTIDGKRVRADRRKTPATERAGYCVVVLNKPIGVVTTLRDEHARKTVADVLPKVPRLFPIGRLDADTAGVLLCTNDGELAHLLAHPSSRIERTYHVRVSSVLTPEQAARLEARNVNHGPDAHTSFDMTLREGKNRQVRRMCAQLGLRVVGLTRTQFGPVALDALAPGATRPLSRAERDALSRWQSQTATRSHVTKR